MLCIYLRPIPEQVKANIAFHQNMYLIIFWHFSAAVYYIYL